MPQVVENPRPPRDKVSPRRRQNIVGRLWPWLLAALALGLILFLMVWNNERKKQYFKVEPVAPITPGEEYKPLPIPLPGNEQPAANDAPLVATTPAEKPRIEEPPTPPPVRAPAPTPVPTPRPTPAPVANSAPVPISQPAPDYPRSAMNAGRQGSVRIRVQIGPDGVPTDTSIVESSGDPELDRAGLRGVRRWRFKPAMADGQPVAGSVVVPIEFRLSE